MELGEFNKENHGLKLEGSATRRGPELVFAYRLFGPLERLVWPATYPTPRQQDGLWEHTCFEAFIGHPGSEAYVEWNFAPNGNWAAYAFSRYRERVSPAPAFSSPRVKWQHNEQGFTLEATIPFQDVAAHTGKKSPLRISLTAVLEHVDGRKTYWALKHAAEKPDFHQAASFVVELA